MSSLPSPNELFSTLEESQYGAQLAERTRFNDFKPDWVQTDLWCDLLGPDVNNLYHMQHTQGLAERFAHAEDLDAGRTKLLLTTAATHDIGEAIIGDIALPSKTSDDEKREKIAYRQIVRELFGKRTGDTLTEVVWSVLNKTDPKSGDMFRAVEYIGYCTTAMRAGQTAVKLAHGFRTLEAPRAQREQLLGGLLGLEKAVSVHNYPVLANYVKLYPGIEEVL